MKKLLVNAGLGVLSVVFALVLLELGVRMFVAEPLWRFRDGSYDWTMDPEIGWVNRPALDVQHRWSTELIRYQTNSDGLAPVGARRERTPGVVRIMVFGDSMVVGRDLPQEQNYPARLEAILRERGIPAEVINAGVLGYSTDQALLLMQRFLPRYKPDLVIFASTSNDFGGNSLRVANMQAKGSFLLDADGALRFVPPEEVHDFYRKSGPRQWIQHSALYRLLQPRIFVLRSKAGSWEDRMLLGVMDDVYIDPAASEHIDWRLFGALIARMQEVSRENGAQFVLIANPELGEVWDPYVERTCKAHGWPRDRYDRFALERHVAASAQAAGVRFIPLIEEFSERQDRGPFHLLPYDGHLNTAGHELMAERLADHLSSQIAALRP
jgi:lysophospholipase L1-like esterase